MSRQQITIDTYNRAAQAYQDKFMEMELYNDTYNTFCNSISNTKAKILEIGCGPGNVTKHLLEQNPKFEILGTDVAPNMAILAQKNNPTADFMVLDCKNITKLKTKFDAVMCGFCLPYISKEESVQLISDASSLLKDGGIIYLSTMEGDYESSGFETTSFSGNDKIFVYYHRREILEETLRANNFEIIDFQTKQYPEPDGTFLTDLIFIAKKLD